MQIRLTVLGPRSGRAARACDVLITAPAGTSLGAVAGALASAAGSGQPARSSGAAVALFAGAQRLAPSAVLGVPPLVDGALLSLHAPAGQPGDHGQYGQFGQYGRPPSEAARLHVVGGPDAGGVHLLQGGQARIGRSADADVPLDDPDVSRLHCEVAVGADGLVTVADLGSTNGTFLSGRPVGDHPLPLLPGALLRIGESTLRLEAAGSPAPAALTAVADSDGHLRVSLRDRSWAAEPGHATSEPPADPSTAATHGAGFTHGVRSADRSHGAQPSAADSGSYGVRPADVPDGGRSSVADSGSYGSARTGLPYDVHADAAGTQDPYGPVTPGGADPYRAATSTTPGGADPYRGTAPTTPGGADSATGLPSADPGSSRRADGFPGRAPSAGGSRRGDGRTDPAPGAGDRRADGLPGLPATDASGMPLRGAAGPQGTGVPSTDPGGVPRRAAGPQDRAQGVPTTDASGNRRADGAAASAPGAGRPAGAAPAPGTGANRRADGIPGLPSGAPGASRSAAGPGNPGRPGDAAPGEWAESGRRATGERRGHQVPRSAAGATAGGGGGPRAGGGVVGSIGAWARRRLAGGKGVAEGGAADTAEGDALRERWPDAAAVLLTALGPGRRLWERGAAHPDAMTVRLGTADLLSEDGTRQLPGVPFTVDLRGPRTAALTLAGPRPRLAGLARAVLAQLCALHSPAALELVLVSADRARTADQRAEEWSWLNWLPHLRPAHGQDCRLLLAFDRDQAEARAAEVVRRLEAGPLGAGWASAAPAAVAAAAASYEGPFTLLVVDGDPGSAALRETVARIAVAGPSAGVHVLCLTETGERPVVTHGVVARLSGDVATTLRIETPGAAAQPSSGADDIVLDAVSAAWAEHFARALAPLRESDAEASGARSRHALPGTVRLLDELDLALATPAKIAARWADAPSAVGAATAVLGVGAGGRVAVDLLAEGPHALIGGAPGAGKTELLRSVVAALAAGERPDRLSLVLVDGAGQERGDGLLACADLPHVSTHLVASDPVRMREFAQALGAELKRRAEVLDGQDFSAWHADRMVAATVPHQSGRADRTADGARRPAGPGAVRVQAQPALPRLVVVVDDFDELVAPGLGSTGRPAAGSVVRALEAVARDGRRLGVHLVASTGRPERTAGTETDQRSRLRIALRMQDPESAALLVHVEDPAGLDDALPGRGYLRRPGGGVTPFQAGRVSGRIPRTATLRPTVVPLEWERMGDPPARRQVRELGNGPTDLALLASALQRAAESTPDHPTDPATPETQVPAVRATPLI